MKLDKHVVDMFTELTKPADDVKMEKTCYGTISVVDGTRYVKLDGSDLLVPAASTVKTSHGDRVTVLMKNHSLTVTGNLTAPATDGEGGSSGEAGTAATIEVGTVTTGEAGSSASVTNSGTTSKAVFDFVIPKGDKGDTGPQGPQGEKGDTGTWDGTIPEHTHNISDITNFPESLPANGGNANTVNGRSTSGSNSLIRYDLLGSATDVNTLISTGIYRGVFTNYPSEALDGQGTLVVINYLEANDETTGTIGDTTNRWIQQWFITPHANDVYCRSCVHKSVSDWAKVVKSSELEIASNPNLLINPDYRINQRGKDTYTGNGTAMDMWIAENAITVSKNSDGTYTIESSGAVGSGFYQRLENYNELVGKTVTLSICAKGIGSIALCANGWNSDIQIITLSDEYQEFNATFTISGAYNGVGFYACDGVNRASVTPKWMKLELGSIATPFCPPDPATELAKCQRYFCKSYLPETAPGTARAYSGEIILNAAANSKFGQSYIAFPVSMRIIPTVTIFNPDNGESGGICHSGYADTISAGTLVPGTNGFNIFAGGLTQGDDYYMHYTASAEL